jgi:hypothetical protein
MEPSSCWRKSTWYWINVNQNTPKRTFRNYTRSDICHNWSNLTVQDKKDEIEEENEVSRELSWNLSPLTHRQPTSSSGSPEWQLPVVENMLSWINNSRLFDDVFPRQWHYKWIWSKTLNVEKLITPCLWGKEFDGLPLFQVMFGTLQSILCIAMPEFIIWRRKIFELYNQWELSLE